MAFQRLSEFEVTLAINPSARAVAIVANPYGGARRNRERVAALVAALQRAGLEPRPMWEPHELADAAGQPGFADEFRCVVAAGGDGTLNRVINQQSALPVAMFPLGNENLFGREFGHRNDPAAIVRMIQAGKTRTIDLGVANEQRFCCVASAGFDADVAHRLAEWRSHAVGLKRVSRLSYVRQIVGAVWNYQYPIMRIEADGVPVQAALVMVFNLPQYAFHLKFVESCLPDDGMLDWVAFETPHLMPLVGYTLSVMLQRHWRRSDVKHGRARHIRLSCETPVPFELDGDAIGFAPIELTVLPRALTIMVADGAN
ncbi:MAG: hypothetical protein K8T25_08905 [Planctomycetia bacterium]|nr:hypothetical protein [Planctomycetia bacterium]